MSAGKQHQLTYTVTPEVLEQEGQCRLAAVLAVLGPTLCCCMLPLDQLCRKVTVSKSCTHLADMR